MGVQGFQDGQVATSSGFASSRSVPAGSYVLRQQERHSSQVAGADDLLKCRYACRVAPLPQPSQAVHRVRSGSDLTTDAGS